MTMLCRGQMKLGVVGGGRWGQNIIKTLHHLGNLYAIAESNSDLSANLRSNYPDVLHFNNHLDLLQTDVDGVIIATPAFTHFDLAKQALFHHKHVLIEKPMARTVSEADELVSIAEQGKRILMVGHLLLYQPAIQVIKNFLAEGKLGKIYSLRQTRCNLGTIRSEEDVVYSLGVHDLAVLSYLMAESVSKVTVIGQDIINPDIADDVIIHLKFASGVLAHLQLNWLWPYKERHLMILGEKGALFFDELKQTVTFFRHEVQKDNSIVSAKEEIIYQGQSSPLELELKHFMTCIRENSTPISCGRQGRDVVVLLNHISNLLAVNANV